MSRGYLLVAGFGASVVMWATGYLARLPGSLIPASVLAGWFAVLLVLGGGVAARISGERWRAGLGAMAITSLVNLLVVGSLIGGRNETGAAGAAPVPTALLWIPGTVVAGAVLGALGGFGASRGRAASRVAPRGDDADRWNAALAWVAVSATLMLLLVGGIVTSENAGLAVVDWPNSYGYNMFLYPLARMTGPIYFEHAHRLFGSLVGLTTLVLAIRLALTERRAWVKIFAAGALLLVVIQGVLGGLRVTGRLTMSQSSADTAPSLGLAVVHGVTAQLFFGCMVALAVFTTGAWRRLDPGRSRGAGRGEVRLAGLLLGALLVQLVLGAFQRHLARGISIHMMLAGVVAILAYAAGTRAWQRGDRDATLGRIGVGLIVATTAQLGLGFGALVTTGALAGAPVTTTASVIVATAHQTLGAVLLALAVATLLWTARLHAGGELGVTSPLNPPSPRTLRES